MALHGWKQRINSWVKSFSPRQLDETVGWIMIDYSCPKCGNRMSSPDGLAGQSETCPNCGNTAAVPQPQPIVLTQPSPPPVVSRPAYRRIPRANRKPVLDVRLKGAKSTNGLGVAALVLGILASLTCWIPFIGMLGIPLAVLGLLFGGIGFFIALVGRKSGVGMPISGGIVCIVALIIAIAVTGSVVDALDDASDTTPGGAQATPEKRAYLDKVLLKDVHVADNVLNEKSVFGEVKNTGDRSLKEVKIMIYCLDRDGRAVFEKEYYPVLVSDRRFSTSNDKPLKPNYSEKFGYRLDDAPSEWSGKVRVEVVDIEFGD